MAKTYLGIKLQDLGVYQTLDPKDKIVIVKDNDEGVMALQEFFFYVQSNLDMGNYYTSTQVNNLFMAKTDTYTRQVMDTKFALVEKTYTRLQSDARYSLLTDTYTKEESDSKYAINDNVYTKEKVYTKDEALFAFALKSEIPILPDLSPYSTTAKGDLRWAMRRDVWSKTEADARFANINNYYTKTETDGKYAVAANTYTKAEADTKFMDTTEAYSKDYINLNMYTKTQVYTKAESNNLYPLKNDVYTVAAVNDQFAAKSWVYSRGDAENTFAPKLTTYTKTEVNSLVDAKVSGLNTNVASSYYTKTDADAKFALIGSSYTKVQTDAKYALAADVLTATQTATKYYNKTETDDFFSANVSSADAKFALKTEALKDITVNPTTLTFTRVDNTIGTVAIPTWNQSTTGNAATATKLATPRSIAMSGAVTAAGVNFDGSANISLNATSILATKLSGIVPNANLSGYYTGISFKGINNANNVQFSNELTGTASGRVVLGIVQAKSSAIAQSGAIVIQTSIPALTSSVMKSIAIKGMVYSQNGIIDLTISSYNTSTGVNYQPAKINNGGLEIPVKIAANASGKLVYILGEVSDTWSYPHIAVTEALLSYGVTDAYTTGWSISYLTDLTGFTNISAPLTDTVTAIRSKWENIVNTPTTVSGYGITDAYTKAEVYNKTEADTHYTPTGTAYSKGETDAKYELKGVAYDKSTSDTRYLPTTPSLVNITNGGVAGATLNLNTTISNSTQLSGLYWNRGTQLISELRPLWSSTNNTWLFGLNLNAGTTSADTTAAASRVLEIYPNYIWHKTYGRMDSYFRLVSDSYTKAEVDTAINNVKAAYLTTANAASTYTTITNYNTLVTRVANEEKARQDLNTYLDTYFAKSSNYWDRDASDAKYYSKSSPTLDINTTADAWTEGGLKLNTTFATGEGPAIQWNANNVTKAAIASSNVSGDMNFYIQQNDNSMGLTFQVSKNSLWHKSFGDLNIYFRKASDSYTTTQVDNAITNALTNYYDKATSDTKYAAAANTYTSAQIDSMVVKVNETRDVTSTGLNKINKILINRTNSPASGISWYSDSHNTWQTIMAQAGVAGQGVKGNVTPSAGTLVTSWALRNIVEPAVGYGWTFESMASGDTTPTIVAEIRARDGASRFAGAMTVNNDFTANKVNTSVFNTPSVFSFLNGVASQKILTGGVLASSTYADQTLIPANGIYSRGNIQTAGNFIGTAVTQAVADNSTQIATTAFTQSLTSGVISKAVTGGAVALTDIEAANQVINLTGTLTANLALTFPATFKRMWVVYNNTTGAFKVTAGLSAGASVNVVQGKRTVIYADATGMYEAMNDFESIELTGTPTSTTPALNDSSTNIATTSYVKTQIANDAPTKTGGGASGTWGISVTGNSATATQLATARTISLSGDVTGSVSFDGSANANIVATVPDDSHNHSISTVNGLQSTLDSIAKTVTGTIPATPGWYRIASTSVDITRNSGRFELDWTQSGSHGQVIFNAAIMYGDVGSVSMTQVLYSRYGTLGITKARIVYNTAYTGKYAYLEIYSDSTTALTVNSTGLGLMGWTLLTPSTVGSIPSGYTSREMIFRQGVITEGQLSSTIETGTAPLVVASTTAVPNLNADMVDNFHASQTIIANTIAVRDGSGNLPGNVLGNAATATKLATARTIAMSGAVTGAATSFDGTSNISINATSVDATKLAGAIPNANMSGIYDGISIRLNKTSSIYTEGSGGKVSGILLSEYRSSGNVTGAIVFTSPHAPNSTMRRIRIQGFLSNGNNCIVDVQVSSYTYTGTNINNYGKISLGNRDIDVRFGTGAAGLFCIILGDASTVWAYPHLAITEAQFSHVLPSVDMCNNWSSGIVTDLSTFTTVTPYFQTSYSTVQVDWTKIPNSPTSVAGYGITDAYTKTEVNDNFVKLNESRAVTINKLLLNKSSVASAAINWYKESQNTWQTYLATANSTGNGVSGNITAPTGTLVNGWALRNIATNLSGYGWTFESMAGDGTAPTVVAEIRATDGSAKFNGSITSGADITAGSGIVNASTLKSSTAIKILNGVAAQGIQMGSLLVSSAYTDETNVPANGIWSKGNIQTAASFVGNTITQVDGTSNTALASTAFVQNAVGGYLSKTGLTGGTVALTDAEVSNAIMSFAGALTSNLVVTVPTTNRRLWSVINGTTGAFTLTIKTPSGSGVTVAQGKRNLVYTDGTNVLDAFNDFESIALTGTPTSPTAAVGTNTTQIATTAFVNAEIANDAPSKTGTGASGSWGISVTGNAATATKLQTARTINGVSFDGTANITVADSTKLPTAGGTITGNLTVNGTSAAPASNATNFGISSTVGTAGNGISLYGGVQTTVGVMPSSGFSYSAPSTFGTHGAVTATDWAVYLTCVGGANRGWIFKNTASGTTGNVASISATGQAYFSYVYSSGDMYSSGNISSSGYLYSGLQVNANYVINRAGSYNSDNRHTFYSNRYAAQGASVGNILVSDDFTQSTNVPTNGIYSKGDIKTAGAITASGDVTAFSDKRLKDNVLPVTNALEKVKRLNGVTFTRTDLEDKEKRHIGLIAQDVQAVFPEAVKENEDGILSVNYSGLIGALVETIKELDSKNTELEARLSKLEELIK